MTDLEEYEKEYLKRHEEQKKENGKGQTIKKAEEEKKEKTEVSKLLKTLDYADYTMLESQRTSNVLSCLQLGFEKILDAEEKLVIIIHDEQFNSGHTFEITSLIT